jgi:hypothetical protein
LKTRKVALYGSEISMSAISASLQNNPQFQVRQIEGSPPDMMKKLEISPPDVILFDLAAGQPDFAVPLLRNHPEIMLIGVDLMSQKMLVVSGEHSRLSTAQDLAKVIEGDRPHLT